MFVLGRFTCSSYKVSFDRSISKSRDHLSQFESESANEDVDDDGLQEALEAIPELRRSTLVGDQCMLTTYSLTFYGAKVINIVHALMYRRLQSFGIYG